MTTEGGNHVMKKRCFLMLAALLLPLFSFGLGFGSGRADAVPAYPEMLKHTQSDGKAVNFYIKGDEFLSWMTDEYGNLAAFGNTEETSADLYLASWIPEANFVPPAEDGFARQPLGKVTVPYLNRKLTPPLPGGMPPQLKEESPPEYIAEKARAATAKRDAAMKEMTGAASGARLQSRASASLLSPGASAPRAGIVIYVRFPGDSRVSGIAFSPSDEAFLSDYMFNKTYGAKSVAAFYNENTGGAADINPAAETFGTANDGVIAVDLPGLHNDWGKFIGSGAYGDWIVNCAQPALDAAASYINFASYDTNGDGTILPSELFIGLVVQGGESSCGDLIPSVWGVSLPYPGLIAAGKIIGNIFEQGATQLGQPLTIGIAAHELGHALFGFPDLYDTSVSELPGFGYWSLMAQGSWSRQTGERGGETPSMIDPYCLYSAGLAAPNAVLNKNSSGTFTAAGHTGIYLVSTDNTDQYFLLQPRDAATPRDGGTFTMIDKSGPYAGYSTKGLFIVHVDGSVSGSFSSAAQPHPGRAVEEAHGGGFHLLGGYPGNAAAKNNGDLGDLFGNKPAGAAGEFGFGTPAVTDPDTNLYSGSTAPLISGQSIVSGIRIWDIKPLAGTDSMSFRMGTGVPADWYVKTAAAGLMNGMDWDNASSDLSGVMALAADGDNIYVAEGTYTPSLNIYGSPAAGAARTFPLWNKGCNLTGGYANASAGTNTALTAPNWDPWTFRTILDGEDQANHVMYIGTNIDGATFNVSINGFTVTRGNAASFLLSYSGGGIYMGANLGYINFRVTNCRFIDNFAVSEGGAVYGSALRIVGDFTNCTFSGNRSKEYGGGAAAWYVGGQGPLNYTNCTFVSNTSGVPGGAILSNVAGTVTNCTFVNNTDVNNTGYGNAISAYHGLAVRNSLFVNNGISGSDVMSGVIDGGYNIFGLSPGRTLASTSQSLDPAIMNIGSLSYNTGVNETIPLLDGSPAIDVIPAAGANLPAKDQRYVDRPVRAKGDVGAFEASGSPAPVSGLVLHPKKITALAGDRNLLFTVWPGESGGAVPSAGTWTSNPTKVAVVEATTPSAGGRPQGKARAVGAGEAIITFAGPGGVTADGTVEVLPLTGSRSPAAPELSPSAPQASPILAGAPMKQIAAGDISDAGSGRAFAYPLAVVLREYAPEGFTPSSDALAMIGDPKIFEIDYDSSAISASSQQALPLEITFEAAIGAGNVVTDGGEIDLNAFFSKYGVFKQIGGKVFDLSNIVKDAGISLSDAFSVNSAPGGVKVTARICLIDSGAADVTASKGSEGAFVLIYDGKNDGMWSDPLFVAERKVSASPDSEPAAAVSANNGGGGGCEVFSASVLMILAVALALKFTERSRRAKR
ncbi:hypothetical protein FACS1894167_00450 [Synergistales bacterium]|nr:hypothetical protein FACS1894167_00450 [Synergistales bacterium]